MSYKVSWHEDALEDLRSLDKPRAREIVDNVDDYLAGDPLVLGKPLKGIFKGLFRYRCGDYRVLYSIDRKEELLSVLTVGHRKNIYRRRK